MAQPQQEPVEDCIFPADPDLFPSDSVEQSNQQNLFDWLNNFDAPTYGNTAIDNQISQQAEDGMFSVPFDIGGSIPVETLHSGELELESYFGPSDHTILPVVDRGLWDGAAVRDRRLPTELVAIHSGSTLAELNCGIPDSWNGQNYAPMATVPRAIQPSSIEMTSWNAFVDPYSTVNHPATETGTGSSRPSQAITMCMSKADLPSLDGHLAWFPATLSDQGANRHHNGSITEDNTAFASHSHPEQPQRPIRRKRGASEAQFPGCLTIDLGLQVGATKKPRKAKTKEQLEVTRIVRSRGACLRCRFEKQKVNGQQTSTCNAN